MPAAQALEHAANPPPAVDYEKLFPKPWTEHKQAIIQIALPLLVPVMLCSDYAGLTPRQKVEKAMQEVAKQQKQFWGVNEVFTRRRTVIDSILSGFYNTIWEHVAASHCGGKSSSSGGQVRRSS